MDWAGTLNRRSDTSTFQASRCATAKRSQLDRRERPCDGCCNYDGEYYGGTQFVCAMHPYGWDGDKCPDYSFALMSE
jgi:hypothetical protein